MLDTLHITLIITTIFFTIVAITMAVVAVIIYREKNFINYQLDRFKTDILEKQSTSYNIPNFTEEKYEKLVFKSKVLYNQNRKEYFNLVEEAKLMVVSNAVRDIKRFNLIKIENCFDTTIEATLEIYVNKKHLK